MFFLVYVNGIHPTTFFKDIGDIFSKAGEVQDVYVPR